MVSATPFRTAQFKSAFGPKYQAQPHFLGFTSQSAVRIGTRLAFYGAPAAIGVLLFASGIPRVQRDILQKVPYVEGFFRKEIHPADNPF